MVDLGRALLAILLASALYIVIRNDENPERTAVTEFRVPVDVVNVPPGLAMVGDPPSAQMRVRVPTDVWPRLRPEMFRATGDAAEATAGPSEVPVSVERLDPSIRSVEPFPPRAAVVFEEIREISVPVRVNVVGNVPFGYSYQPPRAQPDRVTVAGPVSRIQRVESALVEIRLDGITVSVDASYVPRLVDSRGGELTGVRVSPASVNITVGVTQQLSYKEVGVRPRLSGRVSNGYFVEGLETDPTSVTVVGEPQALATVDFVETQQVELGNASSTVVRRVQLSPPRGIGLLQTQPISVTVQVAPIPTTQVVRLVPSLEGLGPGLQLVGELPPVDLTISGPAPTLRGLAPRAFGVALSVAGLSAGEHKVTPRVIVPSGVQLDTVEPSSVAIVLRAAVIDSADAPAALLPVHAPHPSEL